MAVKAVILEFVQLLGTQQSRNGFTEVIVSLQQTNLNHLYHPWDGHVPFKLCLISISEEALTVFLTAMISPTGISLLATRCRPLSTFLEHEKLGNMQYASHQPDDIDTIGEGRVAGISGRQLRNLDHF